MAYRPETDRQNCSTALDSRVATPLKKGQAASKGKKSQKNMKQLLHSNTVRSTTTLVSQRNYQTNPAPSQATRNSFYNSRISSLSKLLPECRSQSSRQAPNTGESQQLLGAKQNLSYISKELTKIEKKQMSLAEVQEKLSLPPEMLESEALAELLALTAQRLKELNMKHSIDRRTIGNLQIKLHNQKRDIKRQQSCKMQSEIFSNWGRGPSVGSSDGSLGSDELSVNRSYISRGFTDVPDVPTNPKVIETPRSTLWETVKTFRFTNLFSAAGEDESKRNQENSFEIAPLSAKLSSKHALPPTKKQESPTIKFNRKTEFNGTFATTQGNYTSQNDLQDTSHLSSMTKVSAHRPSAKTVKNIPHVTRTFRDSGNESCDSRQGMMHGASSAKSLTMTKLTPKHKLPSRTIE